MTRRKKISISAIVLLLLVGICWWAFGHESAQLRKVRQLMKDNPMPPPGKGGPPAGDRAKFDAMRKEVEKLNPVERMKLFGGMRQNMEKHMVNELNNYFAMTTEQKKAYMDNRVKEMEKHRKEMEQNKDKPPTGGPGGPGGKKPTFAQMRAFHTQMMSHVSPVMRAQMSGMRADERAARVAAGLSPDPGPPGRH